ncbi:MAG: OFA family MFS transporter [Treponema sp.]|jgi:MFS family permease|nr:OFA family MFS transporter [Treponema sp.]
MPLTKKRWLILGASCLINLCIGSLYAWSVFATPMAEYLSAITGRTVTHLAIVFTVANLVGPVTMISGGFINDRFGPRLVIFSGGILFSGGMFLSGFANSPGMLIVSYGLGVGLGMSMVYGCTISNSVKFFPDRRGLAGGLATAFYGAGSILVPPVANKLINAFGVTMTFRILGIVMLFVISAGSFFVKPCPPGFTPGGWQPGGGMERDTGKDWRGMLADPVFYVMLLLLCCGAFSGLMVISQASPIAQRMVGMNAAASAVAVSALALLNTCGRIAAGIILDKTGPARTLTGIFVVSIIGLLALFTVGRGDAVLFYTGLLCVGLAFGSIMGIFPGFTAEQFGTKNNSVNYGIMFTGFAVSGYFGPALMSGFYDQTGSYKNAFLVAMCLAAAGMALSIIYTRMVARKKRLIQANL